MELKLSNFLDLETEKGWKVRDLRPLNGHHLVYKAPIEDSPYVILPDLTKRKSIRNIVLIRGFVLRSSAPWRRKYSKKMMVWDEVSENWKAEWNVWDGKGEYPTTIEDGCGILYYSYVVGKVKVHGLSEPLVLVREIDIHSTFPASEMRRVGLPDKAFQCTTET